MSEGIGQLLAATLGLGVAGLDPAGALLAAAALAAGARDRAVLVFGLVVVLVTAVWGTVLSLTVGAQLAEVNWLALIPAGRIGAIIELVIGAGLLAWAAVRLARRPAHAPKPRKARAGTVGLVVTAVLFALSATLDPTFLAVTVLAGRSDGAGEVVLAQVLWVLISQLPLVLLMVAVARGGHQAAVARFTGWWNRAKPVLRWVVTIALLLVGPGLILDAVWWFATGEFLVPAP